MDNLIGPLRGTSAIRHGTLTRKDLGSSYFRVYPDVYLRCGVPLDAAVKAQAAWIWSRGRGVLAGWSAAALWGVGGIDPRLPATINLSAHIRPPEGIQVFRDTLDRDEHVNWLRHEITTAARTAFDLGRRLPRHDAIEALDAIYHATMVRPGAVSELALRHPAARGSVGFWEAMRLASPDSTSRLATQVRLALRGKGLPPPELNMTVADKYGEPIALLAFGWRRYRVGIRCIEDPEPPTSQLPLSFEEANALTSTGWKIFYARPSPHNWGLGVGHQRLADQVRKAMNASARHLAG